MKSSKIVSFHLNFEGTYYIPYKSNRDDILYTGTIDIYPDMWFFTDGFNKETIGDKRDLSTKEYRCLAILLYSNEIKKAYNYMRGIYENS